MCVCVCACVRACVRERVCVCVCVCLQGGMFTKENPSQLLIVLEPEAASIYCRRLRMHQLMPEVGTARPLQSPRRSMEVTSNMPAVSNLTVGMSASSLLLDSQQHLNIVMEKVFTSLLVSVLICCRHCFYYCLRFCLFVSCVC